MSVLATVKPSNSMLSDESKSGAQDFFELGIKYFVLTAKYPTTGLASSVDVELQTARNVGYLIRYPISGLSCPNVMVVVKDARTLQVIGSSTVVSSFGFFVNDCIGKGSINLSWPAGNSGKAIFEIYEDGGSVQQIDGVTPVYVSQEFDLNLNSADAKNSGFIRDESENPLSAGLLQLSGPFKQASKLVGVGLISYFLWTNREVVNASFKKLAGIETK